MGIVWEASHKGVPLLGVPGITLDFLAVRRVRVPRNPLKGAGMNPGASPRWTLGVKFPETKGRKWAKCLGEYSLDVCE